MDERRNLSAQNQPLQNGFVLRRSNSSLHRENNRSYSGRFRIVRSLCKFSCVLNVVLLLVLVGILVVRNLRGGTIFPSKEPQRVVNIITDDDLDTSDVMCIPCDDLGESIEADDTLYDSIFKTDCGHRICCVKDRDYLHSLVKKMVFGGSDGDSRDKLEWWRQRRNSAHLYMDLTDTSKLTWTADDATGSAFKNVQLTDMAERIKIPEKGLYFVYAVFSFDFGDVDVIPQVYHNITSQHPLLVQTGARAHLMSKYGGMSSSDKTYTSFLCGVIHFHEGFEIGTHASNLHYVDKENYKNFFGLFQI